MNVSRPGLGVRVSVALLLAACGGGSSTEPSTGSLSLAVSGLPTGVEASVAVTGPGGFSRTVAQTGTLSALAPGSYSVTATAVTTGAAQYQPVPASQPVTVSAGQTASAGVAYAVGERSLAISVAGLPAGTDAAMAKLLSNADAIAKFLSGANPNLPYDAVHGLLAAHGSHHVQQISEFKAGQWDAEAKTWAAMKDHMYVIADALADAIAKQFPDKFR